MTNICLLSLVNFYDEIVFYFVKIRVLDPIIENRRTYGTYDDGIEKISGPTVFHKSGSELDWIEPSLQLHDSTSALHDPRSTRVYDAFHLLQTDPSVQVRCYIYLKILSIN